jgi:hypothetical protein
MQMSEKHIDGVNEDKNCLNHLSVYGNAALWSNLYSLPITKRLLIASHGLSHPKLLILNPPVVYGRLDELFSVFKLRVMAKNLLGMCKPDITLQF